MNCSFISGRSRWIEAEGCHVLRLEIDYGGAIEGLIFNISRWLPRSLQSWIRKWFPGPFLASTVVVKQLKSPDWEEEFDTEILMYERLRPLQGSIVPVFYGETKVEGERALVLEDVGGRTLGAVAFDLGWGPGDAKCPDDAAIKDRDKYSEAEIERMVRESLAAIVNLGVKPQDANTSNCLLVDGRVVFIDHEQDELVTPDTNVSNYIDVMTKSIMYFYTCFVSTAVRQEREELERDRAQFGPRKPRPLPAGVGHNSPNTSTEHRVVDAQVGLNKPPQM